MRIVSSSHVVASCLCIFAAFSPKASVGAQAARSDCSTARTTLEGQQCRAAALAKLDAAAAAFEDSVFKKLDTIVVKPLRRADAAWLSYRNLECAAAAGTEYPGSVTPTLALQCKIDLATERLRYLRATYRPWLKP